MTDNEIIKRLDILSQYGNIQSLHNAIHLIKHKKAEIEKLKKELTEYELRLKMSECTVDEIKSEAIKGFAQRLKHEITLAIDTYHNKNGGGYYLAEDVIDDIDCLVKEMTE